MVFQIISGIPPTLLAIIGREARPASSKTYGKASVIDVRVKISNAFKNFDASSFLPTKNILFFALSFFIRISKLYLSSPSPIIKKMIFSAVFEIASLFQPISCL
ncbi:MAG: hypothetical protein NTU76_01735 [Candidatus Taylorbacteria bacterium]|nr:hypothetical protein [Candidatus Taylorbacteria bacterium]